MKVTKDAIEFTHEETEALFGSKICECGTLLPLWEWAKRRPDLGCPKCKALPSQEDLDGKRREHTPADWNPKV
jgi:hypothetical protein